LSSSNEFDEEEKESTERQIVSSFTLSSDNASVDTMMPPPSPRLSQQRLVRKRAESLDGSFSSVAAASASSNRFVEASGRSNAFVGRQPVSNESLVDMELLATETLAFLSTQRRGRSASCHVLSPSQTQVVPDVSCETIFEEISHTKTSGNTLDFHNRDGHG